LAERSQKLSGAGWEETDAMQKRVLLAEDEPNIATSLQFLLDRAGYVIRVRESGVSALEDARANPPDLLILDVMLPDMDGLEVLKHIRSDAAIADLPILMLTAKGARETQETAIATGADAFITKPFANADVLAVVQRLVSAGRAATT